MAADTRGGILQDTVRRGRGEGDRGERGREREGGEEIWEGREGGADRDGTRALPTWLEEESFSVYQV